MRRGKRNALVPLLALAYVGNCNDRDGFRIARNQTEANVEADLVPVTMQSEELLPRPHAPLARASKERFTHLAMFVLQTSR